MTPISIFTPTYNRAITLPRLYQSLCKQNFKDFEWIIVDDGSTDDTEYLIQEYIKEGKVNIIYVKQSNGGKHRAINRGVNISNGYLFFIVDSDDYLADEFSLAKIAEYIPLLQQKEDLCGITGNRIFENKRTIGGEVSINDLITNFIELRERYKLCGDKVEVIKTSIMMKFPFPEVLDEKFCPEGLIWNRISCQYKTIYKNTGLVVGEYLADGLSANVRLLRQNGSSTFMNYYSEYIGYNVSFRSKIKCAIAYWATFFKSKISFIDALKGIRWWTIIMLPLGWSLHIMRKL